MPGRSYSSPIDFNDQFTDWLGNANAWMVRALRKWEITCPR